MATALATDNPTAVISIQATPAWREWVTNLAAFARTDKSKLIDSALADLAGRVGFQPPPPRWHDRGPR